MPRHTRALFRVARPALALTIAGMLTAGIASPALAANHPERQWLVLNSAHFAMHYYPGIEKTALAILKDAEAAYPKLAADFGVHGSSGRIPIILTHDAFFNGEAEPVKDRITLDPGLASSSVVGTQRFVAHELAHVMTFRAIDNGNKLASISSVSGMPTWFLEGIAQYTAEYWYPSNDRMLRLETLENTILTDSERTNFRMLGVYAGAAGYNEGFSLCRYMFETYGHDKIALLMANIKEGKHTFEGAVETTFGTNLAGIEAGWKQSLRDGYKKQIAGLQEVVPGSQKLVDTYQGEVNVQPRLSPDGKRLAYLSSRYQDSFLYLRGNVMGFLSLYLADPNGRNAQMLPIGKGAVSSFCWSADGSQIVYSRVVADPNGNPIFDLFLYDLKTRTTTALTHDENTREMAWRPESSSIVFVSVHDGQDVLKLVNTQTKKVTVLMKAEGNEQYRNPAWSPTGDQLALVAHKPGAWGHLVVLNPESARMREITRHRPRIDDSNPVWTPDGRSLVFQSDRGGMSNLYRVDLASRKIEKLTNTYRGAEMPCLSPDGKSVLFTTYRSKGSQIYRMPLGEGTPVAHRVTPVPSVNFAPSPVTPLEAGNNKPLEASGNAPSGNGQALQAAPAANFDMPGTVPLLKQKDDQPTPTAPDAASLGIAGSAVPYKPTLTNDILVPEVTSDEKGEQVGLGGTYSDILNKHQLGFDVRYGIMSQRFSYQLQYINKMSWSSWMVSLFDQPEIALSPVVDPSNSVVNSLYFQRNRGASFGLQTPLGSGRSLLSSVTFGTLTTLDNPMQGNFGQLREGQLNTLQIAYAEQHMANTIDADVNPSDGYRLGLSWMLSDHAFGSAFNFSKFEFQGARYFSIIPEWRNNLAWHWDLGMINGEAITPFLLGGAVGSDPVYMLRGYAVGQFSGNRVATTGLEYTAPIFSHLDKQFGPLYLDRLYITGFTDVGSAWNQGAPVTPYASFGGELRLRTLMSGQMLTFRVGLAEKLGSSDLPGFYLTF